MSPKRWLLILGYLLVLWLRGVQVLRAPAETTDVLRNVGYGRAFWEFGLRVYDLRPIDIVPHRGWQDLWPANCYDYPVVTLLFFALLAKLSTSLVLAKAVLSVIEVINALMVAKLLGRGVWGLVYFASPASLWWVSSEGQFEPLVVSLMLGSLCALRGRHEVTAWLLLSLAVQAKLFPILLVPYFLRRAYSARGLAAFLLGFAPSGLALLASRYLLRMFQPNYWPAGFNPFAWNLFARESFDWMPEWLALCCALVSGLVLILGARALVRALSRRELLVAASLAPLLLFVCVLKTMSWVEFWYFLLVPGFALAAEDPATARWILVVSLFEPRAVQSLLQGPAGLQQWVPIHRFLHGGA